MLTPVTWLVPHLATLLVDHHRGHRTPMLIAFAEAGETLRAAQPRAIVVVDARWTTQGPFMAGAAKRQSTLTDYNDLGVEVRYDCPGAPALARAIAERAVKAGVRATPADRGVDSGVTVPMSFLLPSRDRAVVPLSVADRPLDECRVFGAATRQAIAAWPEPVAFLVSGHLTFNPHAWRIGREPLEQRDLDQAVIDAMRQGQWDGLAAVRDRVAVMESRGDAVQVESELRHLEILRGFLGDDVRGDLRCYEGAPGAGAALVSFEVREARVAKPERKSAGA